MEDLDTNVSGIDTGTDIINPDNKSTPAPMMDGRNSSNLSVVGQLAMRVLNAPDADIETLERVMTLQREQEQWERDRALEDRQWEAKKSYMEAFAAAQKELPQIAINARNDHTSSSYANLEAVYLAITPVITRHGFSMKFRNGLNPIDKDHYHAIAVVSHRDGHEEEFEDHIALAGVGTAGKVNMTKIHAHGATKTYVRRYLTLDIWNPAVMSQDSDGNSNNISDPAQELLNRIADCGDYDLEAIQKISEDISAAGNKLTPVDLPRVRKAWVTKKRGIEDRIKAKEFN